MRTFFLLSVPFALALLLGACSGSAVPDNPTAEQRFRLGMNEYAEERYFEALQHFDIIRLQFPGSAVSDSSRFFSGMSRFHREEYLLGSYEFNQLIQGSQSSPLVPDAFYMYTQCLYGLSPRVSLDQTYTERAIDALQTFTELFPGHARADNAVAQIRELRMKLAEKEYRTGILYTKLENPLSALVYFDTVIDKYFDSPFFEDAVYQKARILARRKRVADLEKLVRGYTEKNPTGSIASSLRELLSDLKASLPSTPR